jgi:hypothetical protein
VAARLLNRAGIWYPNSELLWTLPGEVVGQDELTCRPIYGEATEHKAFLWLEMNVPVTPLNAEPWDEDFSSEWLRINLSGRFLTAHGRPAKWPVSLNSAKIVTVRYLVNSSQVLEAEAYVFPVATLGLRRPQMRHGDGIRVQARVKPKYLALNSYNKVGQEITNDL